MTYDFLRDGLSPRVRTGLLQINHEPLTPHNQPTFRSSHFAYSRYQRFAHLSSSLGFTHSRCDHSLFIYRHDNDVDYLLFYVDGSILTASFLSSMTISHVYTCFRLCYEKYWLSTLFP